MMTYAGAHHYLSEILSNNLSSTVGGLRQHVEECREGLKKVLAITQAGKHSMRLEVGAPLAELPVFPLLGVFVPLAALRHAVDVLGGSFDSGVWVSFLLMIHQRMRCRGVRQAWSSCSTL